MTEARFIQRDTVITEEILARARSRIGGPFQVKIPQLNWGASRDTIVHFVDGIGDRNPLYRDKEYASHTKYGRLTAPPCFLYSIYWPNGRGGGLPGVHAWHSGNDWEWYLPVLEGDEFTVEVILEDVVEKKGRMSTGRMFITYDNSYFRNQRGELVAKARGWAFMAERAGTKDMGKYANIKPATYTLEELDRINEGYDNEIIRGAIPRYWEDVHLGEELTPIVKGPLSMRDMILWCIGGGTLHMKAHGLYRDYVKQHPALDMTSAGGEADNPELVHMQENMASEIGIPTAYDYGLQRMSWMGNLLTNWAGDDGFVKKMYGELRLFNLVGDTTWLKGKVTKKYIDEQGEPCVDIDCWGENQGGEISMPGHATVILPSKEKGTWPLGKRLFPK